MPSFCYVLKCRVWLISMGGLQFSEQTEEKWVGGTEGKQDKGWGGEKRGQTLVRL